jgi:hypothetical protein
MSYNIRAFCTTEPVPTIRTLLTWLREAGYSAEVPGKRPAALDAPAWKSFELVYDPNKESLLVECNRNSGKRSLCAREVQEELESLEGVKDSDAKRRVVDHLSRTRFILCCRVDGDPDHEEAGNVLALLDCQVDHCGAILDVEDEGFYSCSDMPLLGRCVEDEDV